MLGTMVSLLMWGVLETGRGSKFAPGLWLAAINVLLWVLVSLPTEWGTGPWASPSPPFSWGWRLTLHGHKKTIQVFNELFLGLWVWWQGGCLFGQWHLVGPHHRGMFFFCYASGMYLTFQNIKLFWNLSNCCFSSTCAILEGLQAW